MSNIATNLAFKMIASLHVALSKEQFTSATKSKMLRSFIKLFKITLFLKTQRLTLLIA